MRRHLLLAVAALAAPVFATYGVPDPLAESHAFVYEDRFIDAYLALEPLLTDGECSDSQESALWLAERLCAHIAASDRLYMRYDLENPTDPARGTWGSGLETALQEWAFVSRLNGLGADFAWDNLGGGYAYGHGFARLLLSRYPNTRHRAAAEFYAITPGYNTWPEIEPWLAALQDYLDRHGNISTIETARARHTVAAIYDDLWEMLTHNYTTDEATGFTTADREHDASRADGYRRLALRFYAEYLLSTGSLCGPSRPQRVHERLRALRLGEPDGSWYILND